MTAVVYNTIIDQGADWYITFYYKSPATITNIVGNGTTVTFTAANGFTAGQLVSISGAYPDVYNFTNATVASANANQFTVTNAATGQYMSGGVAYAPVNLTGYTSQLQVRSTPDTAPVLSLSTSSGITITALEGRIDVHATAAQTTSIVSGGYYYDIEITAPTTVVTRLAQGQVFVSAQVTQ
jgi:hypothetical protein